jgi:hypothetical protein
LTPLAIKGKQRFIVEHSLPQDRENLNSEKTEWNFRSLQLCYLDILIYNHLGDPTVIPIEDVATEALNLIRQYYSADWSTLEQVEFIRMHKVGGNHQFKWYKILSNALLIALLAEDAAVIQLVADYTESWFVPEAMARPIDPSLGHLYISVAAAFRSKPLYGQAEMEESIRKNRKKAPKVLFSAWEAARSGNQALFEEHLRSSVILFEKQLPEDLCNEDELIAFPHSTILAAARRIGIQLPKFEPRIMARLLTSESVGFK